MFRGARQVPTRIIYIFLERHTATNRFFMETAKQYRKFAEECRRYALVAATDEQRKALLEMEAAWAKLAIEAEGREPKNRFR